MNWSNPGREFDYQALQKYHKLRDENKLFVSETKVLETEAREEAIRRYRLALDRLRVYDNMTLETGLVAELTERRKIGDLEILDRLTLCLKKNNQSDEAREEAVRYFDEYTDSETSSIGRRVAKRVGISIVQPAKPKRARRRKNTAHHKAESITQPDANLGELPIPSDQVERNHLGKKLEDDGNIEDALRVYMANISEGFAGDFPYRRAAILHRKRKDYRNEIDVLERAVQVFKIRLSNSSAGAGSKLGWFVERLAKAKVLDDE